ncbi:MAG: TIGR03067 domain-containing protein [Planctomycetia bacterium]|nr:TIGR03067 domain-containing protein [Planctomycetia bacterium]
MKRFAVAFVLVVFSFSGSLTADEKGLKELEGTYKLLHAEKGGKVAPKVLTDVAVVTIKGDEFVIIHGPDDKKVGKIKVNSESKPATFDLMPSDGEGKGKTYPGIYKIEKGEVTVMFNEKGERPKEFKPDEDSTILVLKKVEKK